MNAQWERKKNIKLIDIDNLPAATTTTNTERPTKEWQICADKLRYKTGL